MMPQRGLGCASVSSSCVEHYASIAVKAGSEMQFGTAFKVVLVQDE